MILVVSLFFIGLVCLTTGQQSCPQKFDQMMKCFMRLDTNADYNTILDKKVNTAKTCGATDKNVQCWRAAYKCVGDAAKSAETNPVYQTTMRETTSCYNNNPNSPLAGLGWLFGDHGGMGKHHGNGKGPPENTMSPNQPMGQNMWTKGSEDMDVDKMPRDCMPTDWRRLTNCTKQAMLRDETIRTAANRLRPVLKRCEDMMTDDCDPETPELGRCVKQAVRPYFDVLGSSFKTCMSSAGFPMQTETTMPARG